jgi:hypothetical protein
MKNDKITNCSQSQEDFLYKATLLRIIPFGTINWHVPLVAFKEEFRFVISVKTVGDSDSQWMRMCHF